MCSVSLRQLERHFATHFRTSPKAWSRELRLRTAKQLLCQGWSNKAIAMELAFTDNAHFCREFKKLSGQTPHFYSALAVSARLKQLSAAALTSTAPQRDGRQPRLKVSKR